MGRLYLNTVLRCAVPLSAPLRFVRLCPGYAANSLGDLRRTSGQSNWVVSAHDRLCPSLAARRSPTRSAFCPPLATARSCEARLVASPRRANLATYRGYRLSWPRRRKSVLFNLLWIGQFATWPLFCESGQVDHAAQLRLFSGSAALQQAAAPATECRPSRWGRWMPAFANPATRNRHEIRRW
jgi:hypothetical protein